TLEDQVLIPIQDMVEMGLSLSELESRISTTDYYAPLFTAAFGDATVTTERISLALAQFTRSMVSSNSKFDQVLAGTANFTASEARGRNLFGGRARCSRCHMTDLQTLNRPRNIGLDATNTVDGGVGDITGNQNDLGRFKAASLRNVAASGPYMHDGRFQTLDQVVNFYNAEIQNNPNLDNILRQNGQPRRLNLNQQDRDDIVAFLNTLTDQTFLTNPKFSDPFVLDTSELTEQVFVPIVIR
ncbi:MAG: cytochrome-c peroxidase, partial [Candidatus Promineifilaceae bacterium]